MIGAVPFLGATSALDTFLSGTKETLIALIGSLWLQLVKGNPIADDIVRFISDI